MCDANNGQCAGGELQDWIDKIFRKRKLMYSDAFICDVMKPTLRALAFMHSEKFMHTDLKPQNIMLVVNASSSSTCSIKTVDFGLMSNGNSGFQSWFFDCPPSGTPPSNFSFLLLTK